MKQAYRDILDRIPEPPAWWDVYGVPRWGEIPEHLQPFAREIECQACRQRFRVLLVDEVYGYLRGQAFRVMVGEPCPADPAERHVNVEFCKLRHFDGETREFVCDPLPDDWSYGDPPFHGCSVGETMSSVADYEFEEWERAVSPAVEDVERALGVGE